MLSMVALKCPFWVFGMTRPGIEPKVARANTLTIMPISVTGGHNKIEDPCLLLYLPIVSGRIIEIIFSQVYKRNMKCKQPRAGFDWLVGWLVWFYGASTFIGYLTPSPFYVNNQLYFKQFSLAWIHSWIF